MTERLSLRKERHSLPETFTPSFALPIRNRKEWQMPPWKNSIKAVRELPETMKQASSLAVVTLFVAIIALVVSVFTAVTKHGA
jgi:hypothetical protein